MTGISPSSTGSSLLRTLSSTRDGKLLPVWILIWLWLSAILCILDVCYTMLRPWTLPKGPLGPFYYFWNIYSEVDYRYLEQDDLVTMATGRVMVIEIIMNFVAIVLNARRSRHTLLTTFTTSAFVFWKTVWYMALYIRQPEGTRPYLNPESSTLRLFLVFWVADGIWVIVPFLVLVALWNRLAQPEYIECKTQDESIESA